MKINLMRVGAIQTNCYIIETDKKNAIVIDPGDQADSIIAFLNKQGLNLKLILLTHGHYDHIGAITKLKETTGCISLIHEYDNELLQNPDLIHSGLSAEMEDYIKAPADKTFKDGDTIELDDIALKVMHTPGHSKGSCIFICDKEKIMFSGDTIFEGTIGRSDLYGGSDTVILKSAKAIASLAGEYTILPGHGNDTLLSKERITNPFMGTNYDDIF